MNSLSVMICTWNNSIQLEQTLAEFCKLEQLPIPWELVIVSNNCSDNTNEVVSSYSRSLPIKLIEESRQGLAIARNTGLKNCSYEYIVFADDDIFPPENWLTSYYLAAREYGKDFYFGGSVTSRFEDCPPPDRLLAVSPTSIRGLYFGDNPRLLGTTENFLAANWCCPKSSVEAVGGFDTSLGISGDGPVRVGEETDLQNRLKSSGMNPMYLPNTTVEHFVPAFKCRLPHIADRAEATAFDSARKEQFKYMGHPQILGFPRWMLKEIIIRRIAIAIKKLTLMETSSDYVKYRQLLGAIKGYRSMIK